MTKTTDPYEEDKDFADFIKRMGEDLIRDYKESLTGEDFIKAGDLIRSLICRIEGLENAIKIRDRKTKQKTKALNDSWFLAMKQLTAKIHNDMGVNDG